jgi:hypothetical protein
MFISIVRHIRMSINVDDAAQQGCKVRAMQFDLVISAVVPFVLLAGLNLLVLRQLIVERRSKGILVDERAASV